MICDYLWPVGSKVHRLLSYDCGDAIKSVFISVVR
jgi:hypothetical protein